MIVGGCRYGYGRVRSRNRGGAQVRQQQMMTQVAFISNSIALVMYKVFGVSAFCQ